MALVTDHAHTNLRTPPMTILEGSRKHYDNEGRPRTGSHGLRDFLHRLRRTGSSAYREGESPSTSLSTSPVNQAVLHMEREEPRPRAHSDAATIGRRLRSRITAKQYDTLNANSIDIININQSDDGKGPQSPNALNHIGPHEFVAMFRARAYSDTKHSQLEAARNKALANVRAQRVRTYSSGEESTTPRPRLGSVSGANDSGMNGSRGGVNKLHGGAGNGSALSPLCSSVDTKEPHLIVWCDPNSGTSVFRLPVISVDNQEEEKEKRDECGVVKSLSVECGSDLNAYVTLLQSCCCYDIMPHTNKVVMLDSCLTAGSALFALIQNRLRSALVWDSSVHDVIGLLTVTDFIKVLLSYAHGSDSQVELSHLEGETLLSLRHKALGFKGYDPSSLSHVTSDTSLYDTVIKLSQSLVRRLPVITMETGDVIGDVTAAMILSLLEASQATPPPFSHRPIRELGVGNYGNRVVTVTEETPLIVALDTLVARRLTSLPVVDEEGRLVGMYRKSTALNLALDESYCQVTQLKVGQVLSESCRQYETCYPSDSLLSVFTKLVHTGCNQLVVVSDGSEDNKAGVVQGVVSASDVLYSLVLNKQSRASDNSTDLVNTAGINSEHRNDKNVPIEVESGGTRIEIGNDGTRSEVEIGTRSGVEIGNRSETGTRNETGTRSEIGTRSGVEIQCRAEAGKENEIISENKYSGEPGGCNCGANNRSPEPSSAEHSKPETFNLNHVNNVMICKESRTACDNSTLVTSAHSCNNHPHANSNHHAGGTLDMCLSCVKGNKHNSPNHNHHTTTQNNIDQSGDR